MYMSMPYSNIHRDLANPDYYIQVKGKITQDKDHISTMQIKTVNSPGMSMNYTNLL